MRLSRLLPRAAAALCLGLPLSLDLGLRAAEAADEAPAAQAPYPGDAQAQALRQTIETNLALAPSRAVFDEMMMKLNAALKDESETSGHPMLWALRGKMYLLLRNGPLALADFTKALELDPTHPDSVAWATEYYVAAGQVAEAEPRVKAALERHPDSIALLNANLTVLTMKQDWAALEPAATAMIPVAQAQTDPTKRAEALCLAYARLAQSQGVQGRFAEAAENYRLSLQQRDNHEIRFGYAECLERAGSYVEAQRQYNLILAALPANPQTEVPRQRLAGKIAMIEPQAAEERARQAQAAAAEAATRKLDAIVRSIKAGEWNLYDFDDENNYFAREGWDDAVPEEWLLSNLAPDEKLAVFEAFRERAAAWEPSPLQQAIEAWLLAPGDAAARELALKLFSEAPGETHIDRIEATLTPRVWASIPDPVSKDHTPEPIAAARARALELWEKLIEERQPPDRAPARANSFSLRPADPATVAWFAEVQALRPKLEEIVAIHPLVNALNLLAILDLVAGDERSSRERATLAVIVYYYNIEQHYIGGAPLAGVGPGWAANSFAGNLWSLSDGADSDARKQIRALAVRILEAVPRRDWDAIIAALGEIPPASYIAEVELRFAVNLALSVEGDGILARRLAQPVSDAIDAGAAPEKARADIDRVSRVVGSSDPRVAWLEAKLLEAEGKPAESLAKLKAALGADPLMPEALAARAATLERDGDNRGAMLHYNAAVQSRPTAELAPRLAPYGQRRDGLEAGFGADKYRQYAEGFNAFFRSNEAETYGVQLMSMERLRQLNNPPREYYLFRGYVLERMKRYDEAIETWKALLGAEGADTNLACEQLGARYYTRKDYAASADWYSKAIENGSQNPDAYHWRGSALFELKRFDEALADLDEALKRGGTRAWSQLIRARIFAGKGQAEPMKAAFDEARRLANAANDSAFATQIADERARKLAELAADESP